MKRPKLSREENARRIAAAGAADAGRKFEASREKIRGAMSDIEVDVEKHGGVYPHAGGRVTMAEVLRRAGKSEAYLRKDHPNLRELKEEVETFVDRANTLVAQGARTIRRNITDRVTEAKAEADRVRQAYAEAELEHNETLNKLAEAEKTIEELQAANAKLLQELAGKTVVQFERGARK